MKNRRTFFFPTFVILTVMALLTACNDDNDAPPPPAPDSLGEFAVGYSVFTAVDSSRGDRSINVSAWYPVDAADAQTEPLTLYELAPGIGLEAIAAVDDLPVSARQKQALLVFSHGYGGVNTASAELMETLASHGFIVVAPEHTGNSQTSNDDTFDQAAANRVPDVSFLINTMINRSRDSSDAFSDRIDENNVGVIGHSFGGMTAVGMAAGWAGAPPDERVKAIVPISAVFEKDLQSDERSGPNAGFTADQVGSITVPTMLIGGTADVNVFIENNDIAFSQLTNASAAYQVNIIGANHTHFANVCDIGNLLISLGIGQENWPAIGAEALLQPYADTCSAEAFPIEEVVRLQNIYAVSFFKRYLLGDKRYAIYLDENYAESEDAVTFSSK